MLKSGEQLAHFAITTLEGRHVEYRDLWQQRNLVLISVPAEDARAPRLAEWSEAAAATRGPDNEWLITTDTVCGVGRPGVVVADQWGEVHFSAEARTTAELPGGDDLVEWLQYLEHRCPECEGEAK